MHNLAYTIAGAFLSEHKYNQLDSCMQQTVDLILYRHGESSFCGCLGWHKEEKKEFLTQKTFTFLKGRKGR